MPNLTTTVIGSYPKYPLLAGKDFNVRWLVSPGDNLDRAWKNSEHLKQLQDDAVRWAVTEQESAGLDILTDGEQRRGNFVFYHCQHLDGFDFEHKREKPLRGGTRRELVPTITGPIRHRKLFLADEFTFLRSLTKKEIKITMPGPLTIIDSTMDLFYRDERELAMDLAHAIRKEVEALARLGCNIVQFDEPAFLREPGKFHDYGLEALQECFPGVEGIATEVHICRGYPAKEKDVKAEKERYAEVIEALSKSEIDRISVEDAHEHLDTGIFQKFGSKGIILGAVDIGDARVETIQEIAQRIREVLAVVAPERLYIAPDCGLLLLNPDTARAKLAHMVKAAEAVRAET